VVLGCATWWQLRRFTWRFLQKVVNEVQGQSCRAIESSGPRQFRCNTPKMYRSLDYFADTHIHGDAAVRRQQTNTGGQSGKGWWIFVNSSSSGMSKERQEGYHILSRQKIFKRQKKIARCTHTLLLDDEHRAEIEAATNTPGPAHAARESPVISSLRVMRFLVLCTLEDDYVVHAITQQQRGEQRQTCVVA